MKPNGEVDDRGPLRLHEHQTDAIEAAAAGANYVLTTGTGSGKSLTYIVPIVDRVLRSGSGQGIKAIIVYPINALANSQLGELDKYINLRYPDRKGPVAFARYTGQECSTTRWNWAQAASASGWPKIERPSVATNRAAPSPLRHPVTNTVGILKARIRSPLPRLLVCWLRTPLSVTA